MPPAAPPAARKALDPTQRPRKRRRARSPSRVDREGPRRPRRQRRLPKLARRAAKAALFLLALLLLGAAWFWLTLPSIEPLRAGAPPPTAFMEARAREAQAKGRASRRAWVPVALDEVSPWLRAAVVNSEDARFYLHHGIDLVETQASLDRALAEGKLGRGASTLTQQLAKNLWLGEERSLLRKAREAAMAHQLEALGKERILELYLNVVEWGDGVYGAEAAARTWFHVAAADLSPEQAAVLAAMLPAPRKRSPGHPSARLRQRAAQVLELYGVYHQLSKAELQQARLRLRSLLGA